MDVFAYGAFEDFEDGFFGHGCIVVVLRRFCSSILLMFVWSHAMLLETSTFVLSVQNDAQRKPLSL